MPLKDNYTEESVPTPSMMVAVGGPSLWNVSQLPDNIASDTNLTVVHRQIIHDTKISVGNRRIILHLVTPITAKIPANYLASRKDGGVNGYEVAWSNTSSHLNLIESVDKVVFSMSNKRLRIFMHSEKTGKFLDVTDLDEAVNELVKEHCNTYVYDGHIYYNHYSTTSSSYTVTDNFNGSIESNSPATQIMNYITTKLHEISVKIGYNMPKVTTDKAYLLLSLMKYPLARDLYKPWLVSIGEVGLKTGKVLVAKDLKKALKECYGRDNPEFIKIFFRNVRRDRYHIRRAGSDLKMGYPDFNMALTYTNMGHMIELDRGTDEGGDWIKFAINTSLNLTKFLCSSWADKLFDSLDYQHKFIDAVTQGDIFVCEPSQSAINFLRTMPENKRFRLLTENYTEKKYDDPFSEAIFKNLQYLKDTLDQVNFYKDPVNIPKIIRVKYPEGLKLPIKWETIKELHDKVSDVYREIDAYKENRVISYTDNWKKIDGMLMVTPAATTLMFKLAEDTKDLILWGGELSHCIATFADRAVRGEWILFGLFTKEGKLVYNGRLHPKSGILEELRGFKNSTDNISNMYEQCVMHTVKGLGLNDSISAHSWIGGMIDNVVLMDRNANWWQENGLQLNDNGMAHYAADAVQYMINNGDGDGV